MKKVEELADGPDASRLVALNGLVEKITAELEKEFRRLEKILKVGKRKNAMRQVDRALQWPLTKDEVDIRLFARLAGSSQH